MVKIQNRASTATVQGLPWQELFLALVNIHSIITAGFTKAKSTAFLSLVISAVKLCTLAESFCRGGSWESYLSAMAPLCQPLSLELQMQHLTFTVLLSSSTTVLTAIDMPGDALETKIFSIQEINSSLPSQTGKCKLKNRQQKCECNNEANILEPYNKIHKHNHSITPHQRWEEKLRRKVSGTAR